MEEVNLKKCENCNAFTFMFSSIPSFNLKKEFLSAMEDNQENEFDLINPAMMTCSTAHQFYSGWWFGFLSLVTCYLCWMP